MLSEYRVIEFSDYPAGSILGMHLADQGAEVIKVEPITTSQKIELMEKNFISKYEKQDLEYSVWNRGKKSFALNWNDRSNLLKLISISDIFIENIDIHTRENARPRSKKEKNKVDLKISYEIAKKVNPEIIYIKFTSFPENHPYEHLPSKEELISSASGIYAMNGSGQLPVKGEGPSFHEIPYSSGMAGITAAPAVAAAIFQKSLTGKGQLISMSIHDAMFQGMGSQLVRHHQRQNGNQESHPVIKRFYRCKDNRWININIGGMKRFLEPFLKLVNKIEWLEELSNSQLLNENKDLQIHLEKEFEKLWIEKTAIEWENALDQIGVPGTMCRTVNEWIESDQAIQSETVIKVNDHFFGEMKQPGRIIRTNHNSNIHPAPKLGEHNQLIEDLLNG